MIFASRLKQLEQLARNANGVKKIIDEAGNVVTHVSGSKSELDEVLTALKSRQELSKRQAKTVVFFVDFVAATMPDNVDREVSPDTIELASRLRQEFSKYFGTSAYADDEQLNPNVTRAHVS